MEQQQSTLSAFASLPSDLLYLILKLVDPMTALRLRRVCQKWKNIVENRLDIPKFLVASKCIVVPLMETSNHGSAFTMGLYCADHRSELICYDEQDNMLLRVTGTETIEIGHPDLLVLRSVHLVQHGLYLLRHWLCFIDIRTAKQLSREAFAASRFFAVNAWLSGSQWEYSEDDRSTSVILYNRETHIRKTLSLSPNTGELYWCYAYRSHVVFYHELGDYQSVVSVFDLDLASNNNNNGNSDATMLKPKKELITVGRSEFFRGSPYLLLHESKKILIHNFLTGEECYLNHIAKNVSLFVVWSDFLFVRSPTSSAIRIYDLVATMRKGKEIFREIPVVDSPLPSTGYFAFDGETLLVGGANVKLAQAQQLKFVH